MVAQSNNKKSRELLLSLRERFIDGEKLSVENIIKDYFSPKSAYSYLVAKAKARNWMGLLKRQFKFTHGLWFGNLDDEGNYGVISTEEEVRYTLVKYYRHIKGAVAGATFLVGEADKKGLLPAGMTRERMLVAKIEEEEDEDED